MCARLSARTLRWWRPSNRSAPPTETIRTEPSNGLPHTTAAAAEKEEEPEEKPEVAAVAAVGEGEVVKDEVEDVEEVEEVEDVEEVEEDPEEVVKEEVVKEGG